MIEEKRARRPSMKPDRQKAAAKKIGVTHRQWLAYRAHGKAHCCRCKRWLWRYKFSKKKSAANGLQSGCKECQKVERAEKYVRLSQLQSSTAGIQRAA